MASGVMHSITFTPKADGILLITITGQAQGVSGGDWGASIYLRAYANQGSNSFGEDTHVSSADRLPFMVQHQISVLGGVSVTCGLWGQISGAVAVNAWDVKVDAEVIKR